MTACKPRTDNDFRDGNDGNDDGDDGDDDDDEMMVEMLHWEN